MDNNAILVTSLSFVIMQTMWFNPHCIFMETIMNANDQLANQIEGLLDYMEMNTKVCICIWWNTLDSELIMYEIPIVYYDNVIRILHSFFEDLLKRQSSVIKICNSAGLKQ